jgi:predicted metal-dependent hydrolase
MQVTCPLKNSVFNLAHVDAIQTFNFVCLGPNIGNYLPPVCCSSISHPAHHSFIFDHAIIDFHIIRSRKRRKTSEILVQDGIVYLKTPFSTPLDEIETLLRKKALWIAKKVREQSNPEITMKRATYKDESTLPYLGKNYPLTVVPLDSQDIHNSRQSLQFMDEKFIVYTAKNNVKKVYEQWLFERGPEVFNPIISKYSKILDISPGKILLKNLKSRWGSATFNKTVNLNIHLLKAPLDVIEYVVVHELCHLLEHNHSSRFWKLVSNHMVDYKTKVRWLKVNGPVIL